MPPARPISWPGSSACRPPIIDEVYAVLYEGKDARKAVMDLTRPRSRAPNGANPSEARAAPPLQLRL